MAYNPALYGFQPYQQFPSQQPYNGIIFMERGEVESYTMPPGSISQPLFVDESHFAIKSFDQSGGATTEWFKAEKIPYSEIADPHEISVTKADLDAFKAEIMEVLNEHSFAAVQPTQAISEQSAGEPSAAIRRN